MRTGCYIEPRIEQEEPRVERRRQVRSALQCERDALCVWGGPCPHGEQKTRRHIRSAWYAVSPLTLINTRMHSTLRKNKREGGRRRKEYSVRRTRARSPARPSTAGSTAALPRAPQTPLRCLARGKQRARRHAGAGGRRPTRVRERKARRL